MFYGQLLCAQIPKVQKDTDGLTVIFGLLGSGGVKAVHKMFVKLTRSNFKDKLSGSCD